MRLLRYLMTGIGAVGFVFAVGAVLLFNQPKLGWQLLSVPTGSMRPTMAPGALVLDHHVPASSLHIGDVITHLNPLTMKGTLTHRIIKEYRVDGKIPVFVTKGDANPSVDQPVVAGMVQGKMVTHIPFVGELLMWAKTWVGIAVLIYIPALFIMVRETRRMAVYLQQIKPYYLEGWEPARSGHRLRPVPTVAVSVFMAFVVSGIGWQQSVGALPGLAQSNIVALSPNKISANVTKPSSFPAGCVNTSNVQVGNSTNQTNKSGNATTQNGSSATTGNASNKNSTDVNINVTQC